MSSERHSRIHRGDVTFSKLLVSLLDNIYMEYNTKILFELSTLTIIHIQIIWMTVLSVLTHIFVSRLVDQHLPSF